MKPIGRFGYCMLYWLVRVAIFFWHPVFRVSGRERVPQGRCVVCCNHAGTADPVWLVLGLHERQMPHIMAKDQLMHIPVLSAIFRKIGVIGIKRGENDIGAIKVSIRALKNDEKLIVYPEGTRMRGGARIEAKTGALMLANRTDSPVLPVYIQEKRHPFLPLQLCIGEPYTPVFEGPRPTAEELRVHTDALMDRIYALGAKQ